MNLTLVKEWLAVSDDYPRGSAPKLESGASGDPKGLEFMQILETLGNCVHGMSTSHGLAASLFLAGLVGGMTHCVAMCGPFVMAQSGKFEKLSDAALIPYHLGRLTTYVGLAVLLSTLLNLVFLYVPARGLLVAPILLTAGLIFLVNASPALGRYFSWVYHLKLALPLRWVSGLYHRLSQNPGRQHQYALGILLGFMPCGLVTSALMAASTAPTAVGAAFAMAAFGAGTLPALMGTAFAGEALKQKYPRGMSYVSQGLMVWSGLWLFIMAGMMLI